MKKLNSDKLIDLADALEKTHDRCVSGPVAMFLEGWVSDSFLGAAERIRSIIPYIGQLEMKADVYDAEHPRRKKRKKRS